MGGYCLDKTLKRAKSIRMGLIMVEAIMILLLLLFLFVYIFRRDSAVGNALSTVVAIGFSAFTWKNTDKKNQK